MKERRSLSEIVLVPAVVDADGVQVSSAIHADGKEYPDPVPAAPPVGYVPPTDLMNLIDRVIAQRTLLAQLDTETFTDPREEDDFEDEEDSEWAETPYEKDFSPSRDVSQRSSLDLSLSELESLLEQKRKSVVVAGAGTPGTEIRGEASAESPKEK